MKKHPERQWAHEQISRGLFVKLSSQEAFVAVLVHQGLQDKEIADSMKLSLSGVRWHLREIASKTGCDSRVKVALLVERATRCDLTELAGDVFHDNMRTFMRRIRK